jgi:GWxTD domain-containing protein
MKGRIRVFLLASLAAALALPPAAMSRPQEPQKPSKEDKKKSDRQRLKELATPYKRWLEEEVPYIIMEEERAAFLRLNTNEEREQFIEQFWLRRDETPDTVENEAREEHYRRIAYANERFASGVPGWKTDRGRIYIIWGPPDEIESHPSGGSYDRPQEEGGGFTSTFPFEKWRYRYLEGIGNEVILEFVDKSMAGEYRLTMDPSEKDALLLIPGAGLSELEAMGMASKTERFTRSDGTNLPRAIGGTPSWMNQFERLDRYAKVQRPPQVKYKDLEEVVNFRLLRSQIEFTYRFDFLRVSGDTVLVPITVQVPTKEMTFKSQDGIHSGVLNIYGRITSLTGRVVQVFEDVVNRDIPEALLAQAVKGYSLYQKSVPLRPGLYKLDLVIKDVNSGDVGAINVRMAVSRYEEGKLSASTLILADQIERVATKQIGLGQFVIGGTKVRPRLDGIFENEDKLGIFLQVYNISVAEETHKSRVSIEYRILRDKEEVAVFTETSEQIGQTGEQITIEKQMPLSSLAPGKYKLEIKVTDQNNHQTIAPAAEFTVRPADGQTPRVALN